MRRDALFFWWVGLFVAVMTACSSDDAGGGGAGGAGGKGATTSTTSTTSTSGGGSAEVPDFSFFIVPLAIDIPYGGMTNIDVRIVRNSGFDAPVEVKVDAPPAGLSSTPLVIEQGALTGSLVVGASGELAVGTMFDIKLLAISDNLLRVAALPATVTAAR